MYAQGNKLGNETEGSGKMTEVQMWVATAKIVEPSAVQTKCTAEGYTYYKGAIFCEVPEMGFFAPNLIYCRYGLSIPYLRVQEGWKLLALPTINNDTRWFYTGIVDCGGTIAPADDDQAIIQFVTQMIYAGTDGVIHLSSKTAAEAFVLGGQLSTYLTNLVSGINSALATKQGGSSAPGTLVAPSGILSTKIMGE
jgi:hypothetical protein